MESIRELFRIGHGPSSSHTMAPRRAAELFRGWHPRATRYLCTLYGSLAATGRGHMTDVAIQEALGPAPVDITWQPEIEPSFHPNGMRFQAEFGDGTLSAPWMVYSVGGGALAEDNEPKTLDSTIEDVWGDVCTNYDLLDQNCQGSPDDRDLIREYSLSEGEQIGADVGPIPGRFQACQ